MKTTPNLSVLNRPQVKVCGITRMEDADACVTAGVDAIGFVFFSKSPRNVTMDQAGTIIRQLPLETAKVGVFVNATYVEIMEKIRFCGLTAVQLHGQESPDLVDRLMDDSIVVLKALFAHAAPGFEKADAYRPSAFLVECGRGVLPGGNAMQWEWQTARALHRKGPLILAGGLSPDNLPEAVNQGAPDAVDVSSGVELSPGIKDPEKIKRFMRSLPETPFCRKVF